MRRMLSLLAACLCLTFAACGGDDGGGGNGDTGPDGAGVAAAANAACEQTTRELEDLPPLPGDIDPDRPGRRLEEFAQFLQDTDPDDEIEQALLDELTEIAADEPRAGPLDEVIQALGRIIEHETARNRAGIAGDLQEYRQQTGAAEAAYDDLRTAARTLGAPACTLGT